MTEGTELEAAEIQHEREGRVIKRIPADTFAHRLMLVRADLGRMTIQEAAARSGLNHGAWSKWERLGARPRDLLEVVDAISEGLGIDRDWLLHGGPLTRPGRRRTISRPYRRIALRPPNRRIRRPRRVDRLRSAA